MRKNPRLHSQITKKIVSDTKGRPGPLARARVAKEYKKAGGTYSGVKKPSIKLTKAIERAKKRAK